MRISEHVDRLAHEGAALAGAAERAGLSAAVPTCPGWTVRDLVRHVGNVHRWAATYVRERRSTPLDEAEEEALFGPMPGDGVLVDWYRAGHAALVTDLRSAPADLDCWHFLRAESPLAFWARRQAHETTIHRADAESATGPVTGVPASFAADGIDELLSGFYTRPRGRLRSDPARTLAVVATDVDAAWTFEIGPERNVVVPGAAEHAQCRVGGPASDVYLALWNRRGFDDLDVRGDRSVLDLWRGRATIRWS
jgi:uncharacterized protein (TIGR03083 family)